MFHAKDGWYFSREKDGSVTIQKLKPQGTIGPIEEAGVTVTAESWASIVASVSRKSEAGATYRQALAFHQEPLPDQFDVPSLVRRPSDESSQAQATKAS